MPESKFDKLTAKLSEKGAKHPAALAAWIGRRKYGKAGMERKAEEGEQKAEEGKSE